MREFVVQLFDGTQDRIDLGGRGCQYGAHPPNTTLSLQWGESVNGHLPHRKHWPICNVRAYWFETDGVVTG